MEIIGNLKFKYSKVKINKFPLENTKIFWMVYSETIIFLFLYFLNVAEMQTINETTTKTEHYNTIILFICIFK